MTRGPPRGIVGASELLAGPGRALQSRPHPSFGSERTCGGRWGGGQENQSASVSPNARVDDRVNAASVHELELAKVEDHEARLQLGRGHLKRPQCGRLKWPHLRPTGGRLFIMPFMPFVIQNISIGVALIQDNSPQRVFPRRVAYFNFWIAALFLPGGLLTFFKTGPLSTTESSPSGSQ